MSGGRLGETTTIYWPKSTKNSQQRTLSTTVGTTDQQMHAWFNLRAQTGQQKVHVNKYRTAMITCHTAWQTYSIPCYFQDSAQSHVVPQRFVISSSTQAQWWLIKQHNAYVYRYHEWIAGAFHTANQPEGYSTGGQD